LRADDFRVEERDLAACAGLPLRLAEANSSSCLSLIDLYMLLELAHAGLASLGGERRTGGPLLRC
jgi:hypothetical protein